MIAAFMEEFQHREEIKLATKNFEHINVIESGGCGNFYKEFMMVSHFTHKHRHLVAMIVRRSLFMRYNGSLDGHLRHGDDVVVRWWREGVGSSGGCGVACRLG
nr:hypothetical protein [Tanacetum cinerariifolium]